MSTKMRIVTGFDMMKNSYQVRIEIGTYWFNFTDAESCNDCVPYQGIKMEGNQVDDFIKLINKVYEDHLNDKNE